MANMFFVVQLNSRQLQSGSKWKQGKDFSVISCSSLSVKIHGKLTLLENACLEVSKMDERDVRVEI